MQPYIRGRGRAGLAAAKSLAMLQVEEPESQLAPVRWLTREEPLPDVRGERALLVVATPPGLHAAEIAAAEAKGFAGVVVEKPVAVSRADVARLRGVKMPVAVLHVYRQTWGVQTLKRMIASGELGTLISLEGRYWQSSTAHRALHPGGAPSWKNDVSLSGPSDAWLDVGSHWIDAANYLVGERPRRLRGWRSFANAEAAHRDSHLQVALDYPGGARALTSVSKTMHGATNHFELVALGTRASASWTFLRPDEIFIGEGRERRVVVRQTAELGSRQPPFHGTGWLEGYSEILRQTLRGIAGKDAVFPTLPEALDNLEDMLGTAWEDG